LFTGLKVRRFAGSKLQKIAIAYPVVAWVVIEA
jgi:hypothetical protein